MARAAIRAGTLSAAGDALQRLPASVARPCTCVDPMRRAASTTPGQTVLSWGCSAITAHGVAAPITKPSPSARTPISPGILLTSTITSGFVRPVRSCTNRSVPPESTLPAPFALLSARTASSSVLGALYVNVAMFDSRHVASLVCLTRTDSPRGSVKCLFPEA